MIELIETKAVLMACIQPIFTSCKRSPKRKRQQTPQPLKPPLAENQAETLPSNLLDPCDHSVAQVCGG